MQRALKYLWEWGPFARNANRPEDKTFFELWNIPRDEERIRDALQDAFPEYPVAELPTTEEEVRLFIRSHAFQETTADGEKSLNPSKSTTTVECWEHIPTSIRHILAALNADQLERKLHQIANRHYHPSRGIARIHRTRHGIGKMFNMWNNGFKAGVGKHERIAIQIFFWFLLFCNIFPNVAAGFLGERGYNVRQTGVRVVTLIQWCYLWTFDYPIFFLLFNWSLERLIGALLGNTAYGFAAAIPQVHKAYYTDWFRNMLLGLSTAWQISIQFYFPARDLVERVITTRQMARLRKNAKGIDWKEVDAEIKHEIVSLKAFQEQQASQSMAVVDAADVPLRVRIERLIQFSNTFKLGRAADMLVGLQKTDLENLLELYEDYRATGPSEDRKADDGHVEPRLPKYLLVLFDIGIFAYICYSFFYQPFNFNTVVAYGAVVILKQFILALKRYQTVKAARRLFTNMTAFNVWGIFLVSVPVTVNRNVYDNDGIFAGLLVAMTFATVFLTEPLAPLFQTVGEKVTACCMWIGRRCRRRPVQRESKDECKRQESSADSSQVDADEDVEKK